MTTKINPYNFVPLLEEPVRGSYTTFERYRPNCYSGVLSCRLTVVSPLITADQSKNTKHCLRDQDGNFLKNNKNQPYDKIDVHHFPRNSLEEPIVTASSLKGMIRSLMEAMLNGCMTLASTTAYKKKNGREEIVYSYKDLNNHDHSKCNDQNNLCSICRLFGTINGNEYHCIGRVYFEDAKLTKEQLVKGLFLLKELSSPKPSHYWTYVNNPNHTHGPLDRHYSILGRKFYYHHSPESKFTVTEHMSNDRSKAIGEFAKIGSEFSFKVHVENIEKNDLGSLLLALELGPGLGHKLGLGKAIGLGSCQIEIDKADLIQSDMRYRNWSTEAQADKLVDWRSLIPDWKTTLPPSLIEVTRLNKYKDGDISYPKMEKSSQGVRYPKQSIDAKGVFDGANHAPGQPDEVVKLAMEPDGDPPPARPGETPVWFRGKEGEELIFQTQAGEIVRRPMNAFQAKKKHLLAGKWFLLSGSRSVKKPG